LTAIEYIIKYFTQEKLIYTNAENSTISIELATEITETVDYLVALGSKNTWGIIWIGCAAVQFINFKRK
jgi:hypothetical protein